MAERWRSKQYDGGSGGSRPSVAQLMQNFGRPAEHGYGTGTPPTSKSHTTSMGSSWKSTTTTSGHVINVTSRQSQPSSRSSTGPIKVPHNTRQPLSQQSMSTDSDDGSTTLSFEDGGKARMHVIGDQVFISMPSTEVHIYTHVHLYMWHMYMYIAIVVGGSPTRVLL